MFTGVLGHAAYALDSSFFEAGGTSLTVFALVHRLRAAFGLDRTRLPEQIVYRFSTVEALAGYLDRIERGGAPGPAGAAPILVTMRQGTDAGLAPFFLVASAGGTLGAYEKLAAMMTTPREIVGVRDPFIWGERELDEGFHRWVTRYVDAIRERQPHGPYYVGAYSSAGSFGYEIARRLRAQGEEVALLVLIDPLALDRRNRGRFGWWALRATWDRSPVRAAVKLAGWLRVPLYRTLWARQSAIVNDATPSADEVQRLAGQATRDRHHLQNFAALLELNTGLPFALTDADFASVPPDRYLSVLQGRIARLMPEVDAASIERIVIQYTFQVRAQHAYQLQPYDGRVFLAEPATRYRGVAAAHLRPYLRNLQVRSIPLSAPSARTQVITERFGAIEAHYRSMRDDGFVRQLAQEIDRRLASPRSTSSYPAATRF